MAIYHISLSFAQLPDAALDEFTSGIIAGLDGNPAFPTPTVSIADLTAAQTAFEEALTAMTQGGKQATATKNDKRAALLALLRTEANYVQLHGGNDLPTLLSSGFQVNSTSRTQSPLATPAIVGIENGLTTQLVVRAQAVENARAYETQVKNGAGWQPSGTFTQAAAHRGDGIDAGERLLVQVRAVGGSTGYSGWSDPVSHMAT